MLAICALEGRLEVAGILIRGGIPINLVNQDGDTPLMLCASRGHLNLGTDDSIAPKHMHDLTNLGHAATCLAISAYTRTNNNTAMEPFLDHLHFCILFRLRFTQYHSTVARCIKV